MPRLKAERTKTVPAESINPISIPNDNERFARFDRIWLRHRRVNDPHVPDSAGARDTQLLLTRQQLQVYGTPGFNVTTQA
jgi:hypothetical protein